MAQQSNSGLGRLLPEVSRLHSVTHNILSRIPLQEELTPRRD